MKITISLPKIIALFCLIAFAIYSKSLFNEFVWDSIPQIVNNPSVTGFDIKRLLTSSASFPQTSHVLSAYYKPSMYIVFAAIYAMWAANPIPYHVFQLLVHVANAVMVYYLLRKYMSINRSLFLSLVFLVHPIQFEAAGYVSALQDTLFLFWGLIAIHIAMLRRKFSSIASYILVGGASFLSLLSKETGIACMGIVILYSLMFKKRKQALMYVVVSGLVLAFYFILRINASKDIYGFLLTSETMNLPIKFRILTVPALISYYFFTFFVPINLHIDHQWAVTSVNSIYFVAPLLFLGLLAAIFYKYRIKKFNEKRTRKSIIFFSLWLLGGLAIHSNIIAPIDMTVADRWFYFPSIGLLALIGILAPQPGKKTVYALLIFLVLISFRTHIRGYDWNDKLTLYGRDYERNPDNYFLANKYAATLLENRMYDEAEPVLNKAYAQNNRFGPVLNNLGHLYLKRGEYDNAYKFFTLATEQKDNADSSIAYIGRINIMRDHFHNTKEAYRLARIAVAQSPTVHQLHVLLAQTEYDLGNVRTAISTLEKLYDRTGDAGVYRLIERMRRAEVIN